jgi:hypothetical protein
LPLPKAAGIWLSRRTRKVVLWFGIRPSREASCWISGTVKAQESRVSSAQAPGVTEHSKHGTHLWRSAVDAGVASERHHERRKGRWAVVGSRSKNGPFALVFASRSAKRHAHGLLLCLSHNQQRTKAGSAKEQKLARQTHFRF